MSDRELQRVAVLERMSSGELTRAEGAEMLCLSVRQVKRLLRRYREDGARGIVHRGVGARSNHSRPAAERERVLQLIRDFYSGPAEVGPGQRFGPTLVSEHLLEDHGLSVPVSTLTDWMRPEGLWSRRRKHNPHRRRRERRAHFGELVQLDGSDHDWFEGRGPKCCLMVMTDDATGRMLARFASGETLWGLISVLRLWFGEYGVPRTFYSDCKTLYDYKAERYEKINSQFGRICSTLGIRIIHAGSPQAKGRVERSHGTNQDRLIKKLRLKGISTIEDANRYLGEHYLKAHNERFSRTPASAHDFHLPLKSAGIKPADLWCVESSRRVSNDAVVTYGSRKLLVHLRRDMPERAWVLVRENELGKVRVVYRSPAGDERDLPWTEFSEPEIRTPRPKKLKQKPVPNLLREHPWRRMHHAEAMERMRAKTQTPAG